MCLKFEIFKNMSVTKCCQSGDSQVRPDFHETQDVNQQHIGIDARQNYFSFRLNVKVTGAVKKQTRQQAIHLCFQSPVSLFCFNHFIIRSSHVVLFSFGYILIWSHSHFVTFSFVFVFISFSFCSDSKHNPQKVW